MTAYEFTRINVDFTSKVKAKDYDPNAVALKLNLSNPDKNLRVQPKYIEAKNMFIDCTMSCDYNEAAGWMRYWMEDAIAYGICTKDRAWAYFFLAAYDIHNALIRKV